MLLRRELGMELRSAGFPTRDDALVKVTGEALYTADIHIPDLLHVALVVAPVASARVESVDITRARQAPGVVDILTHENAPRLRHMPFLRYLQDPTVYFAGQPVAMVVAETADLARLAAMAVEVTYQTLTGRASILKLLDQAFAPKQAGRVETDSRRGDPERALQSAPVIVDQKYTTACNNHHPLEPPAAIAWWNGDGITVYTSSQTIFVHRRAIAECYGIPLEKIRIISKYVGGGFGAKGAAWTPCLILTVMATRLTGRPVKLELTRSQMFTLVGRRQQTIQHLKIAADFEGRLTAILHDTIAQTSTFGEYADAVGTPARVLYRCANVATSHRLVRLNYPQPNPMRGPGIGPGTFAFESALDELAHELSMDPLALRLRNYADCDQHTARPWSSNGLRECYQVAAKSFGWETRPLKPGTLRDGHLTVGWGMASAFYPVYRMSSEVSVRMDLNGHVCVRCGTQDVGGGSSTILAQLAASALGVSLSRVSVEIGDTALPEGPNSAGSMATASFAPAVEESARALRGQLLNMAASDSSSPLYGLPSETLVIKDDRILSQCAGREDSITRVLQSAPSGLEAIASTPAQDGVTHSSYAYGAVFAEVRVDSDLERIRVTRLSAAYAAGRVLNVLLARSQLIGGLVGGIGMALHEATIEDERLGRVLNSGLSDYLIPTHADTPLFDIHLIDEVDNVIAGGIKGIGMLGTVGTAGAIANAVFHATGHRVRDLPIRLRQSVPGN